MRSGVLGGTFDPPHRGHLTLAERCREALALDEVLFLPAFRPPHKRASALTRFELRLEMLQAAVGDAVHWRVLAMERDAGGVSYTVRTLERLRAERPADEFWLLIGADSLDDLTHWREPERIVELARVAVYPRRGAGGSVDTRFAGRVTLVAGPEIEISSHEIRARVRAGESVEGWVAPGVLAIIRREGLYREASD